MKRNITCVRKLDEGGLCTEDIFNINVISLSPDVLWTNLLILINLITKTVFHNLVKM